MQLRDVLAFFNIKSDDTRLAYEMHDNSKKINKSSVFIAIDKGVAFIDEAITRGAILILSNIQVEKAVYIPLLKEKLTALAMCFYGHPEQSLTLIGVTGTNGKSTSAYLIHGLLKKALLITTVNDIKHSFNTANTTPNGLELAHIFAYAKKKHYQYVVMEVSSIGIAEKRVASLDFAYILFTNLTSDHLDYHKTLANYHKTKIDFLKEQDAIIVANANDAIGKNLQKKIKKYLGFKIDSTKIVLSDENGIIYQYGEQIIMTRFIGIYNLANVVGALTLCEIFVPIKTLIKRLRRIKPLKGRLNIVNKSPLVIIDYAHTEEAFHNSLIEVSKLVTGHLIVVFGAGGERDTSKRAKYGELVMRYAMIGIVTNDNPRQEDEDKIINDIVGELDFWFIIKKNRSEAIKKALEYATENDVVLITGKGHEEYQIIKDKRISYSDYKEVRKWLKHRG